MAERASTVDHLISKGLIIPRLRVNTRHHFSSVRNVMGLNMINTQILTITAITRSWGLASVASVPPGKIHVSTPGHEQNA